MVVASVVEGLVVVAVAVEARAAEGRSAAAAAAARAPVATEMAEVGAADMDPEVLAVHGSSWETLLAMQVPSEMPVVVMAKAGAAAGKAATAGTAADTEHVGGSRSSRCRKSNMTTARRARHLDRSRRRHTRTYWCS